MTTTTVPKRAAGGHARASILTADERSAIAKTAAKARWVNHTPKVDSPAVVLAREQAKAKREALESTMNLQIRALGLDAKFFMVRQHRFHEDRRWLFDFAFPGKRVALEVQGGTFSGGAHTRGEGYERDCEKMAAAVIGGWRVLYATGDQVTKGIALNWLAELLETPCRTT